MPVRTAYQRLPSGIWLPRRGRVRAEGRPNFYLPPWSGPFENVENSHGGTGGTTLTISPVNTIPVGTLAVIVGAITSQLTTSAADNSTQPGGANAWINPYGTSGAAGTGIACRLLFCLVTRPILSTDVITMTLNSTSTKRDIRLITFQGCDPVVNSRLFPGNLNSANSLTASPCQLNNNQVTRTRCLSIGISGWTGGAVPSGFTDTTGLGFQALAAAAGSGGGSPQVEVNVTYHLDCPTGAFNFTHNFTTITAGCMEHCDFLGPGILGPITNPKVVRMTRSGA